MVDEVVDYLVTDPEGTYIDGTLGAGGHAEAILQRLRGKGRLVGIDRDEEALQIARKRLAVFGERVRFFHGGYDDFKKTDSLFGNSQIRGVFLDLGISSLQVDQEERGFSFLKEGPLDMRMNATDGMTAADLLKRVSEKELEKILREYGEERFSGRIAREVVRVRKASSIQTTRQLADLVARVVPGGRAGKRIHPATRTFQALRIAVNQELRHLDHFLNAAPGRLVPGGRLVMIAYHSLEDRPVKQTFVGLEKTGGFRRVTKKPIVPSDEEMRRNPRSRSAKLRVLERIVP